MTNILKNYYELKDKHPDAVLLFRCGDFYEAYEDDAEAAAKTLGITLTRSNSGVRFTGFPHHALDTYLPRLVRAGYRVAICDQIETPKLVEPRKSDMVRLPELTRQQYELLCECVRYRCADNSKERIDAQLRDLSTSYYDEIDKRLRELKSYVYDR